MPLDGGGTSLTRHCVVMARFPRELIDAVTSCTVHSRVSELGNQNNSAHCHDTSNILTKPRVRTEADAAFEKMLDPIAGSPATGKSVAVIIHLFVDDLFGTCGNEMEQRVLTRFRKNPCWFRRLE